MGLRYPKRRDIITSHKRVVERQRKDDIAIGEGGPANNPTGGGGAGELAWTSVDPAQLGPGVTNAPGDEFRLRYAADSTFFYLRGSLLFSAAPMMAGGSGAGSYWFYSGDFISFPVIPVDGDFLNRNTFVHNHRLILPVNGGNGDTIGFGYVTTNTQTGGGVLVASGWSLQISADSITSAGGGFELFFDGQTIPW